LAVEYPQGFDNNTELRIQGAGNPGTLVVPSRSAEGLSADNSHFQHDSGVVAGLQTQATGMAQTLVEWVTE